MSKIKNGGLDQCGAEHFEQQQFGTAGVEGVKWQSIFPFPLSSFMLVEAGNSDVTCPVNGRINYIAILDVGWSTVRRDGPTVRRRSSLPV